MKNKNLIYTILAALVLAVVALIFFYPDDVEGRVLSQHDIQQGLANGHEGQEYLQQTGHLPRWTNALFGGMPTFQISPSYPANSLLGWIGKLYTLWLPEPANLLFGMMLGFFIMCLCMRMKWPTALMGAVAWGFSTYFIIIIGAGHLWKFMTLMYIPPTIGGLALAYRGKYLAGGALTALFGALQLMSNHIQMSYYFLLVVLALVIAWLCIAIKDKQIKRWCGATVVVAIGGMAAVAANAPSLYNTYVYSKETTRGKATEIVEPGKASSSGPDIDYITQWSYGKGETWSLMVPNVKGGATIKPEEGNSKMLSLAETDKAEEIYSDGKINGQEYQFLSQFPQYFGDQPMTNGPVYVGAFVLMLALLALFTVKSPIKWALFAASLLAVCLSWGKNLMWLTELFVNYFPAYDKFRTVSSLLVVAEFCLPLLACMTIAQIAKEKQEWYKHYRTTFYAIMGIGAAVCFLGWVAPSIFGQPFSAQEKQMLAEAGAYSNDAYAGVLRAIKEVRMDMVSSDSLRSLVFILLGAGVMMLYFFKVVKSSKVMTLMVACVVLLDLFTVNKRYIDSDNFTDAAEPVQTFAMTAADKAILADTTQNFRVMDFGDFSGARSSYFHKTVGGYHAAKLTRYQDLITYQLSREGGPNMEVLNMLNARYFMQGDQYERNPGANGNAWFVEKVNYVGTPAEEMKALDSIPTRSIAVADISFEHMLGKGTPTVSNDTIYETTYAPDRITYHAKSEKGGVAVFSEVYFPWGWNVTVDGKEVPLARVDYVLRAIRIPAGDHTVIMEFNPKSQTTTSTLAYCGLGAIYLALIGAFATALLSLRKNKEEKE